MSNVSPIFPISDSQHFNDYGFNYFQVIEEARKHKRETSLKPGLSFHHFKKPISKDDPTRSTLHNKRKKRWWWKNAFPFFKWRKSPISTVSNEDRRARNFRTGSMSISSPVYVTESRSTPYRSSRTTLLKADVTIPYLSLRELNMDQQHRISASSPIYLVT